MKATVWCAVVLSLCLVFLPLFSFNFQTEAVPTAVPLKKEKKAPEKEEKTSRETFLVLDKETEKTITN